MNIDLKRLKIDMKSNHFCYKSGTRNLQIRSQSRYGYTLRRLLQNNKMATNDKREELRNGQCQNMTSGSEKSSSPTTKRRKPRPKKFSKIGPKSYLQKVQMANFRSIAKRTRMASGLLKRASMRLKIRDSKYSAKENHLKIHRTVEFTKADLNYGCEKSKLLFLCSLDLVPKESALKLPLVFVKPLPENQAKEFLLKRQKKIDEGIFDVNTPSKRIIPNFGVLLNDADDDIIIDKFIRHDMGIALERVNNLDFKLIDFSVNKNNNGNFLKSILQPQHKYNGPPSSRVHPINSSSSSFDHALRIKNETPKPQCSKQPMILYHPRQQLRQQQQQQKSPQTFPLLLQQQRKRQPPMIPTFVSNMNMNRKTATVKPIMRNVPTSLPTWNTADTDYDLIIEKVILHPQNGKVVQSCTDKFYEGFRRSPQIPRARAPMDIDGNALKDTLLELNTQITLL